MPDIDLTYIAGTCSVAVGATSVVGVASLWAQPTNVRQWDLISINHGPLVPIVASPVDDTHLVIPAWAGTTQTTVSYVIYQVSPLRFVGAQAMVDVETMLAGLNTDGWYRYVNPAFTDPTAQGIVANEGQFALKFTTGQLWIMTSGAWVLTGTFKPFGIAAPYDPAHTYTLQEVATFAGSSYIWINPTPGSGHAPPNATFWAVLASIGATGPTPLLPLIAWVTGGAMVATAPASYVSQSGSSYECLISHTSGVFATDLAAGKWGLVASKGADALTYGGSSATSLAIATVSKDFTDVPLTLAYQVGNYVRASSAASGVNFMEGNLTAYSAGHFTINVSKIGGSGTHADWNFQVAGAPGAAGGSIQNVPITGASTTYTSGQANFNVERSNSGSPMGDLLPGTGSILPANSVVTITNADVSALLAISAASGATIKGGTINGYLYLGPGQSVQIQSDGSNYWPIGMPNRARLGAATTFYAASTGSASNHGLTSGSPLASGTAAYILAQRIVDPNGFAITIQVADATYTSPIVIDGPIPGQQGSFAQGSVFPVILQGNLTTPANALVSVTGNSFGAIQVLNGADILVQGFKVSTTSGGNGIYCEHASVSFKTMDFGACTINHVTATRLGYAQMVGGYTISAGASSHWLQSNSWISAESTGTITLVGTPAFPSGFAVSQYPGSIVLDAQPVFSGSAGTGPSHHAFLNGMINTGGHGLNFFPGTANGTVDTGGVYN